MKASKLPAKVSPLLVHATQRAPDPGTPRIARLLDVDERGPRVDFEGNQRGPRRARSTLDTRELRAAIGREVLILLAGARADEPVIVGVLKAPHEAAATEALVDGERVVIRGAKEIVLECGEASITLRANGRIVIHGNYVETRARDTNRIRGGSVKIN